MMLMKLDDYLSGELEKLRSEKLLRVLPERRAGISFASNDYLGLAAHPALREAAARAARDFGVGSGASRLVGSHSDLHAEMEGKLAFFKGAEAALSFSSGYAAALGTIPALVGRGDTILADKLCHASLIDAARLSGATLRVFRHNDTGQLEERLRRLGGAGGKVWILTESVFSMDGDLAPLAEIVALKERFGAFLFVDEAHATGLFGGGGGLCQSTGLSDCVEVQMGTLSKAVGASGGFVAGSHKLIAFLANRARSFVFSTAPTLPAVAAACAGLDIIVSSEGDELRRRLWENVGHAVRRLDGMPLLPSASPILPVMVGGAEDALLIAVNLAEKGFLVPAIRYPTVERGKARLRITVSARHDSREVDCLVEAIKLQSFPLTILTANTKQCEDGD